MKDDSRYPIRYVARITGLPAHVIRAWERRYAAVNPHRTPTNRRLYSEEDIKRLQLLRKATKCGHSISQAVTFDSDELSRLVHQNGPSTSDGVNANGTGPEHVHGDIHFTACLNAVLNLDRPGLEKALNRATIDLTRLQLINGVIVPLFGAIGKRWADGSLKIINEHMTSTVVRSLLDDMLRSSQTDETAPRIVVSTPVGHWHEIGALVTALFAAETGWCPQYFGPNLPAEEIAAAAEQVHAKAVALSISHSVGDDLMVREVKKLRRLLESEIKLFVGGAAADIYSVDLKETGIKPASDLVSFRRELESFGKTDS